MLVSIILESVASLVKPILLLNDIGTSYGRECYCSSTTPASTLKTSDSDCNMPCSGDSSQICGQAYRLNVYSLGSSSSTPSSTSAAVSKPSTSTTPTPTTAKPTSTTSAAATGTATALGCYTDSGTDRTLPDASSSSSSMTPSLCQSTCQSQGYIYAGERDAASNRVGSCC